ncbi:MAG: nitroreductase family deazaflavin-dependent oxidoreductase [Anaerolineae bacterium]|nr:nitroreductase family deazaflavin-dependent oxidoreductase [Anaerolineae bacterium]MCA9908137.1 nitroreductase family deazaflavin-dependent oxidoreductase [Anaerolineae bacterium]
MIETLNFRQLPRPLLRAVKLPPQIAYAIRRDPLIGRLILLLTTTGRRTGLPRVTPLQYEEIDGAYYIGSARGLDADWVRNILADPHVQVRVKAQHFDGLAEVTTDRARITAFLALRLQRHPHMVGALLRAEGLTQPPTRAQLEAYGARLALVIIRPAAERHTSFSGW